jgi:hypothetical protein
MNDYVFHKVRRAWLSDSFCRFSHRKQPESQLAVSGFPKKARDDSSVCQPRAELYRLKQRVGPFGAVENHFYNPLFAKGAAQLLFEQVLAEQS